MNVFGFKKLMKHPYLIPIFVICGVDVGWVLFFSLRTAKNHPDVAFNREKIPWENYRNKQYKFWSSENSKDEYFCQAPNYEEDDEEEKK